MNEYPKKILTIEQQIQTYMDAGMMIPSQDETREFLETVGYYRLRGYIYQLYDKKNKKYKPGTSFSDVVSLYHFDRELSNLLFRMIATIEVSLRVRLTESLLVYGDSLILSDPTVFEDKALYWKNMGSVSSEIARSNDLFIKHNFEHHDGQIPIWAAVEIMSFGTLSKVIKNLMTGEQSAYSKLAGFYKFRTSKGHLVKPSKNMLTSWIHAVAIMRNICAHGSRIYNRSIKISPVLTSADAIQPIPRFNGLYQALLAMKYLRPSDNKWNGFVTELKRLLTEYNPVVELRRINFPSDWENHFSL
jgi:abortive infection bacteriophage resistance protein